jgi:hypothetical protein
MMLHSDRLKRTCVFLSTMFTSLLAVHVFGSGQVFASAHVTAIAAVALLLSLPLVDSAIAGVSVPPGTAGLACGLPVGFFVRQASVSEALASGAARVLSAAALVSLVLIGRRIWRRRTVHKA